MGIPDDLYWRLTPRETDALLREIDERDTRIQRADTLRAGLVASMIYNVYRKKGARALTPEDFLPRRPLPPATPQQVRSYLLDWAERHNANLKAN